MKTFLKNIIVAILTVEARVLLKRKQPKIVAITGSVGKTSTKDAIYTVLREHMYARKSQKSFNSDIGVALSVLGLDNAWNSPLGWVRNIFDGAFSALFAREYPEVLVLEMGVDRPGDMKKLTQWVKPDVVVLTRLPDVPVHVEYFAAPEEVVAEKMELVSALKSDGVLIYNDDDDIIRTQVKNISQQSFGYSRQHNAHFMIAGDVIRYNDAGKPVGMLSTLTHIDESVSLHVDGSLGIHHAYNFAAAAAVGHVFGVSLTDAAASLQTHKPSPGRMRILPEKHGATLIDDTYNSSPVAVEQALTSLAEMACGGKKIVVLGDMLELGRYSVREHERMGEQAAAVADVLITIGVRAKKMATSAKENGLSAAAVYAFERNAGAIELLPELIEEEDVILIKASQSIRSERVVKALMANPEDAPKLLVRQSAQWMKQ